MNHALARAVCRHDSQENLCKIKYEAILTYIQLKVVKTNWYIDCSSKCVVVAVKY